MKTATRQKPPETKPARPKRVLCILSCPEPRFREYRRKLTPNGEETDVLASGRARLGDIAPARRIGFEEARISPFERGLVSRLRRRRYDEVVFFYNNPDRRGYANVELLALLSGAASIRGVLPGGAERPLGWSGFASRSLGAGAAFLADWAACFLLAASSLPAVLVINALSGLLFDRRRGEILFLGTGGERSASHRVRCVEFARALEKRGWNARAASFRDVYGRWICDRPSLLSSLSDFRRMMMVLECYARLVFHHARAGVLVCQKLEYPALAAGLAALLSGRRLVLDYDDWDFETTPELFPRLSKLSFLKHRSLLQGWIEKSDCCVVASRHLEKRFREWNARRLFFIPTGVDTVRFAPGAASENGRSVAISWIGTVYRIQADWLIDFLECYRELEKSLQVPVRLEIAGEGSFLESVRAYAREKNIESVRFAGWIPHDEIPEYLASMDIGVFPMGAKSDYSASKSPTKLFEYMACGMPCVASAVGEAAHVIRDGENGFLASGRGGFVEKLRTLAADPVLRKKMGAKAASTVRDAYSLQGCAARLEKAFVESKIPGAPRA